MTNRTDKTFDFDAELDRILRTMRTTVELLQAAQDRGAIHPTRDGVRVDDLRDRVTAQFRNGFTARMGDACYGMRRVRFSAPLWPRADEAERTETAIHEMCHIVCSHLFPRASAHGAEWKLLMRLAGGTGARCHTVDRTGLKRGQVRTECDCREYIIGSTRAARLRRNPKAYSCRSCRGHLRIVERVEAPASARAWAPRSACTPRRVPRRQEDTVATPAPVKVAARAAAPAKRKGTTADLVVTHLHSAGVGALTVAELAAAIGKSECATNRYARKMVKAGLIRLVPGTPARFSR